MVSIHDIVDFKPVALAVRRSFNAKIIFKKDFIAASIDADRFKLVCTVVIAWIQHSVLAPW